MNKNRREQEARRKKAKQSKSKQLSWQERALLNAKADVDIADREFWAKRKNKPVPISYCTLGASKEGVYRGKAEK